MIILSNGNKQTNKRTMGTCKAIKTSQAPTRNLELSCLFSGEMHTKPMYMQVAGVKHTKLGQEDKYLTELATLTSLKGTSNLPRNAGMCALKRRGAMLLNAGAAHPSQYLITTIN